MRWLYCLTRNSRLLRIHTPHIRAFPIKRAPPALRPLRVADLPSVPNQVHMQRVDPLQRRDLCKDRVSLVSTYFRADQSQALTYAMDMRINWHDRTIKVKHEYTGRCFWPNAWNAAQVAPGFL